MTEEYIKQKYYVSKQGTVNFHCPSCNKSRLINTDKIGKKHTLKLRCSCGQGYRLDLEYRSNFRKPTKLIGSYSPDTSNEGRKIPCTIVDVSMGGLAFIAQSGAGLSAGVPLVVSFQLDDKRQTAITRQVSVCHIGQNNRVGCAFSDEVGESVNKAIYFWLK